MCVCVCAWTVDSHCTHVMTCRQSPVFEWVQIVAEIGGAAVTIFSLLGLCLMCYAYSGAESISIDAEDGFLGDELFDMDVRLQ